MLLPIIVKEPDSISGYIAGEINLKNDEIKILKQSLLSGILIGIGDVIKTASDIKYMGAFLFSLALLTIMQNGLPLYTGRIGFIKEYKITYLLRVLVYNLAGSVIPMLMVAFCKEDICNAILVSAKAKFSIGYLELFMLGILCGVLMLVAVYTKKELITVLCIMVFILSGYEHCVADFPFLVMNFSGENLLKFICIVLGNSVGSIAAMWLMCRENKNTA